MTVNRCLLKALVDELKDLWTNSVRTYDKSTGKMFTLRAAVMWNVNDFPAYAMRWLLWDHEWREKDKEFDENTEYRLKPREWSGDEILEQLNRLDFSLFRKTVTQTRPYTHLNWTHKPMFFELPYWSKLKLRHNLDVMHVEKNVFDTLMDTILDIEGKTKDTIKARLDLERMGIQRVRDDSPSSFLHKYDPSDSSLAKRGIARWSCQLSLDVSNRKASRRAEKIVRNRAKPEGSIIEAWVQYEWLTFCGMYLKDVDTAFIRPQCNNDGGLRNEKLSVFARSARPFGYPVRGESFSRNDMEVEHWFVLYNCDEIMAYLDEHEEMMKREHPSHLYAKKHRDLIPQWFLEYVNKLKSSNSPSYNEELYNLAFGPIRAELFSGCHVNGVKFLGIARDDKLCTQNSGVHVPGGGENTDIDFYGKLTNVVQLLYKAQYQVIMFKCRWFDTNPNRQGSVKINHGLLSVNINRTWYDDDPYILANMARQIVYLDDLKAGSGWKVAKQMDQSNVYALPELDPTDNDVDNVTDQRLESSKAETLRDTNVIQELFQLQGVSSIEIPIQSITIDLGDLPRYEVPVGPNNESDEEEDWETKSDDSEDNEGYYSSDDE
ncbi:hypothetical protein Prudu_009379 [Prunus dulcis]|uniref:DUF4216 domain-containing protein n=1 Tax=Prunus dulcis TaxID=3755 RepID=A0A4Y1R658_PRUDU|nr:hypothetical protein Prudu_009379 [Prunus dulcis]